MSMDERFGSVTVTRRDALKIAGAAGVMAALPWNGIPEAEGAVPALKGPQAGGYYRFSIGEIEAIVINDGGLIFNPIQPTWAPEASKEELEGMLRSAFLPTDRLNLEVNTLLLKIGGELVLIDTGAGNLFGPSLGKMAERLAAAGVRPAQVTAVVISHAHGDHFGGCSTAPESPSSPTPRTSPRRPRWTTGRGPPRTCRNCGSPRRTRRSSPPTRSGISRPSRTT